MSRRIVLYGPSRAPFTDKCRRALILKDLDFELREPSGPEDYARWSPASGLLPVMKIDDELVSDSTNILLRLEELRPEPRLLSPDPTIAAQQRKLEDWADESFLWYYRKWIWISQGGRSAPQRQPNSSLLRRLWAWLRAGGTWERPQTALLREIDDRLADLANLLGTRRFFYSEQLSMADLAVYELLHTIDNDTIPGSSRLLATRPTLLALMQRVEEATGG